MVSCSIWLWVSVIDRDTMAGARVEIMDNEKNTALHIAARHGHGAVVKTLINNGADVFK